MDSIVKVRRRHIVGWSILLVAAGTLVFGLLISADVESPVAASSAVGESRSSSSANSVGEQVNSSHTARKEARSFVEPANPTTAKKAAPLVDPDQDWGPLTPEERIQIVRNVDGYVSGRKRSLDRFYAGLRPGKYETIEEQKFREAQYVSWFEYAMAFRSGLDRGSYFVVRSQKDEWPSNFAGFHAGVVQRGGRQGHVYVVVDRKKYGLDRLDEYLERHRRAWLERMVRDFNELPEDHRRARLVAGHRFPRGIRVDEKRALLVLDRPWR